MVTAKLPEPIQKVLDKTRELQEEIKSVGQSSIKEVFVSLFEQFPQIQSIRWTQYTPHFNDGEPCTFNVNDPEVSFEAGTLLAKKHERRGEYPDADETADEDEYYDTWGFSVQQKDVSEAVGGLYTVMQEIEQVMQAIFGDGSQITVTRNGEIEVEDYDHD